MNSSKRRFLQRCGAALIAGAAASAALAQPMQPEADNSAAEVLRAAAVAMRLIDEERGADLWKASSPFIRERLSQADYVGGIQRARKQVGTVTWREWANIGRFREPADTPQFPAGLYANVDYVTQTSAKGTLRERLSLRLESDGWHPVGYITSATP